MAAQGLEKMVGNERGEVRGFERLVGLGIEEFGFVLI